MTVATAANHRRAPVPTGGGAIGFIERRLPGRRT